MLIADDIPLANIRKIHRKSFPSTNPHHIIPGSRNGNSSQFNLFPYSRKAHSAYHDLFWNLKIDEIWDALPDIHRYIFDSGFKYGYQWWLGPCCVDRGTDQIRLRFEEQKFKRLDKLLPLSEFRKNWVRSFGNESLEHAKTVMRYMMLFMIFGVNMVVPRSIFKGDDLKLFLDKFPASGYRLWAFETCFGINHPGVKTIRTKTGKIIKRYSRRSP